MDAPSIGSYPTPLALAVIVLFPIVKTCDVRIPGGMTSVLPPMSKVPHWPSETVTPPRVMGGSPGCSVDGTGGLVDCAALNDVILGAVELAPDDVIGTELQGVEPVRVYIKETQ
jgi:hypothetical protein